MSLLHWKTHPEVLGGKTLSKLPCSLEEVFTNPTNQFIAYKPQQTRKDMKNIVTLTSIYNFLTKL